jgi:hypothetical protein
MGLFNWGSKKPAPTPAPIDFPPRGSRKDAVPGMDDYSLLCVRQWLDEWFDAVKRMDDRTLVRLLTTYGEALDCNGVRATFNAVKAGIDPDDPRQRPWRWLSLAATRANESGDHQTAFKIFYFMLRFESAMKDTAASTNHDAFIEFGIDMPTPHSRFLLAEQAMNAFVKIGATTIPTPLGDLSTGGLTDASVPILEAAEKDYGMDLQKARGHFTVGAPLGDGVWSDSKSGEFRYGRRIQG